MNCLLHPQRTFREWRRKRRERFLVRIDHPRMDIKGLKLSNITDDPDNPSFIAFVGVPYADPPVENLRFQPPQTLSKYPRVYKAYNPEHKCIQYNFDTGSREGSEDCLYLNIYIPRKPKHITTQLPVLVFIHGGGFEHSSGDISDVSPDVIIKQNLVFVTINYRLNVYGFLNMGTEECRGNAGLKDQVHALKWIRDNIDRFGGDPNNVTISGHSAGATCVNLHMISPLSKGLFHKAIVQAGGIYCPWGFLRNQERTRLLFKGTDLLYTVVETLKSRPHKDLLSLTQQIVNSKLRLEPKRLLVFMGPTLESIEENAFIPYDIEEMKICAKRVPLMAGICKGEGYQYVLDKLLSVNIRGGFRSWINDDKEFLSFLMSIFHWSEQSALKHGKILRELYFPNRHEMTDMEIEEGIANINTDIWFRRFYDNFKIGEEELPFYVYRFSYLPEENATRKIAKNPPKLITIAAPSHGDEFCYQYVPTTFQNEEEISFEDKHIMNTLCTLIGNFCRMGDFENSIFLNVDTFEWRHHTENSPCFLDIGHELHLVNSRMFATRWDNMNTIVELELTTESPSISSEQS